MIRQRSFILSESFNEFLNEMIKQYNVTRDEVLKARDVFGEFKGKIWAYCVVQSWLKKKELPVEDARFSVVNRWYPS